MKRIYTQASNALSYLWGETRRESGSEENTCVSSFLSSVRLLTLGSQCFYPLSHLPRPYAFYMAHSIEFKLSFITTTLVILWQTIKSTHSSPYTSPLHKAMCGARSDAVIPTPLPLSRFPVTAGSGRQRDLLSLNTVSFL